MAYLLVLSTTKYVGERRMEFLVFDPILSVIYLLHCMRRRNVEGFRTGSRY